MKFFRILRSVGRRSASFLARLSALLTFSSASAADFNFAEALQKSVYFYEVQQSGRLSPLNRVPWRGPACLTDGADLGHDLSGGWFDAGDHWTANLTMSFAAMTLAWSAVEHPETWEKTGQMEELIAGLIHVNDYFLRCVHAELQLYCTRFLEYRQTPGGLRLREWFAHEYGSLRHANNAAAIVLYYSDHVLQAPPISGNTWWKKGRSNAELQAEYRAAGRTPVDYALGANPYRRSYLVGFGNEPFNHPHHRGAYGAWAGFEHFIPGKADDRGTNRHVLYGALLAGPDHNDVFLCGDRLKWLPVPGTSDHDFYYQFPNRTNVVRKEGYHWQADDRPEQVVMDSKFNEVALDYNAGFTANLVWLLAHGQGSGGVLAVFPPPETRRLDNDPLRTDREFFVTARRSSDSTAELELTLWNRSRWPARIRNQLGMRILLPQPVDVTAAAASVRLTGDPAAKLSWLKDAAGRVVALELRFPDVAIYPGTLGSASRTVRLSGGEAGWMRSLPWADGLTAAWAVVPEVDVFDDSVPRL